jgi:Sep-tRNA:Cys-tRNA synthetase
MTKNFKLNTYGLSWEEVETVAGAFKEIAEKYGVGVED